MKKSELAERIQKIGSLESLEDIRAEIVNFQKDLETDYDTHNSVVAERDKLIQDNETIRQANMKLFLQVGSKDKEKQKEPTNDLKYEDLFNEKGDLK